MSNHLGPSMKTSVEVEARFNGGHPTSRVTVTFDIAGTVGLAAANVAAIRFLESLQEVAIKDSGDTPNE